MYELCNEELQRKLRANRIAADKEFETELAAKRAKNSADATPGSSASSAFTSTAPPAVPAPDADVAMAVDGMDEEEAAALAEALKMSMGEDGNAPAEEVMTVDGAAALPTPPATDASALMGPVDIGNGLPVGFTGQYELHAIVTHKGRSADSGHYIGWVRQAPGSQFWWCYNDDKVTETRTEEVMKLGGDGADRDMAYLNFYRFKDSKK